MRQLTPIGAPTGTHRPPDAEAPAPLTAPQRPRNSGGGRRTLFAVTVLSIGAAVALVLAGYGAGYYGMAPPALGGDPAGLDAAAAARLAASAMPERTAFEPELTPHIGESGTRVDTGWSPAATSLSCDVTADPPLPAERQRIAVAVAAYTTSEATRAQTGRSERLVVGAVVLPPAAAGRVFDELTTAVPACGANPLGTVPDAQLGTLPNVDGVVFRGHQVGAAGDGPDPSVTCVVGRHDEVVLRSCGLSSAADRADGLAVRGLGELQVRLERARRDAELPAPPPEPRTPNWERDPAVTVPRNPFVPGCQLLTGEEITAATGQPIVEFDRAACRWELAAGSVRLSAGGFGSSLVPARPSVLRGNSAVFAEPEEGECLYKVATNPTAALRISVTLTEPRPRPCAAARALLALAFDRLPPA